jgi:hypothetical protein
MVCLLRQAPFGYHNPKGRNKKLKVRCTQGIYAGSSKTERRQTKSEEKKEAKRVVKNT